MITDIISIQRTAVLLNGHTNYAVSKDVGFDIGLFEFSFQLLKEIRWNIDLSWWRNIKKWLDEYDSGKWHMFVFNFVVAICEDMPEISSLLTVNFKINDFAYSVSDFIICSTKIKSIVLLQGRYDLKCSVLKHVVMVRPA